MILMPSILSRAGQMAEQECRPRWVWPRAGYVHIPFCAHHCGYCDFAVVTGRDHEIDLYLEALAAELATLGRPAPVQTLFLGGGTPTHLDGPRLRRLLIDLAHWLPLEDGGEFTIEANPNTLDSDKIGVLSEFGVNRVSLGAQSFRRETLQVLERKHDPQDTARVVGLLRGRIAQVSLDLIFGVPGQSLADWKLELEQALSLEPDHISTYGLTYEKGTRLWKQREHGELLSLGEEDELAMYSAAIDRLEAAGFEHYEISNFARPGCRSLHNQVYWANNAYFGFGLGAARYVNGCREMNTRDMTAYMRRVLSGESPIMHSETLPPEECARETMAIQLRRVEGIDRLAFLKQTGFELDNLAEKAIKRHVELGLLKDDGKRVFLTREGKYVADAVIAALL
jgi:oxygen-independent coproporphyrinogen-3 oxidase